MDALKGFGELSLGSRLKRLSDYMMKEIQLVYDYYHIDFDPYLFPIIQIINHNEYVTNSKINAKLHTTQPAITQAINKLIKKGLVEIDTCKTDKRKKFIKLSQLGKYTILRMQPLWKIIDNVIQKYTQHHSESLIESINLLENKLLENKLSQEIIEKAKTSMKNTLDFIPFENKYSKDFYNLNIEWLNTFFVVEPYDNEVLSKPNKYIIDKGGHIFFAKLTNVIVGTVALMPTENKAVFELTKMAVSPEYRGLKIGQKLLQYCIDFAKENKFKTLMLYSNTTLESAIYIYKKYGFIEIPMEPNRPYKRSNIKMELKLQN